jgi:hypothetical protein
MEKFANYELSSITDVARFLYERGYNIGWYREHLTKNYKFQNISAISTMLQNSLYAWYVDIPV